MPLTQFRRRRFAIFLSEAERAMLTRLARDAGLDRADIIRGNIRKLYKARFGSQLPESDELRAG